MDYYRNRCADLANRCRILGNNGSCTDCGQFCSNKFLQTPSLNCRCNNTPAYSACQYKSGGEEAKPTSQSQAPQASCRRTQENSNPQGKQSWWQWLLSLIGLGGKKSNEDEISLKNSEAQTVTKKTPKPTEVFSPQAILEEAKEICNEIKNRKPELYNKPKSSTPPPSTPSLVTEKQDQETSPSPQTKKKRKHQSKSNKSPTSPSSKYLGKPIESLTPSPKRRSRSPSKERSPSRKSGTKKGEKSPAAEASSTNPSRKTSYTKAEKTEVVDCIPPEEVVCIQTETKRRPPTSPIYSSEKYLKPYVSEICCTEEQVCAICSQCSFHCASKTKLTSRDSSKRKSKPKRKSGSRSRSPSPPCTMPLCSCPICCPSICPPPCCPTPCIPSCSPCPRPCRSPCPRPCRSPCPKPCCSPCPKPCCSPCPKPCFCSLCCKTPCCSVTNLKADMRKRNSSCGCKSMTPKRRRSSSCPSSPACCTPCPCPAPPCSRIKCPTPPCRPPCPTPTTRRNRSPPCMPISTPLGSKSNSKNYPSSGNCQRTSCSVSVCPKTCPTTCSSPSAFACKTGSLTAPTCPPRYPLYSTGVCSVNSYSRSKDSDALCRQLMAKYNVSAPEPQTFCPIPSVLKCDACDPSWPKQATIYPASPKLYGCSACRPRQNHCINNNRPLPENESCQYDTFEYCNYYSSERTPKIRKEINEEEEKRNTKVMEKHLITFDGSPGKTLCQSKYKLPVRTPPECFKKKGPRSPCQEYVSTYSFNTETKREKHVEETVLEVVDQTSTENKTSKSPNKSGGKSNKTKRSKLLEDTAPIYEDTENVSGNKPLSTEGIDSNIDSDFSHENKAIHVSRKKNRNKTHNVSKSSPRSVLIKTNLSPSKREHSRSPSKSITRKKTALSPDVSSIITNTDTDIYSKRRCSYSPSSKSFFPSFLALTQEAHASNRVKVSSPTKAFHRQPSPKTDYEHSATLKLIPANLLSGNNAKLNFNHITGSTPKYYRAKLSDYSYDKKIDHSYQNLRALKAEQNFQKDSKIDYNFPNLKAIKAEQNIQKEYNENPHLEKSRSSSLENKSEEDVADTNDIIETESSTILPKVESTTTLVEKYNNVEVSANGMLVQSQNKIFDYISAGNSAATNASVKEDPSLSTVDDIVAEDFVNTEKDNIQSPDLKKPTTSTSVDCITDNGTDIDEMSMGVSKINRAHGDDRDQPLGVIRPSGVPDKTKSSDGTNKDQKELGVKPQVETFADRIGLENCAYICMAGESSVDPIEYGTIGESAVDDPERIKHSEDTVSSDIVHCNRSNNKPVECATNTSDGNSSENGARVCDGDDEIDAERTDCEMDDSGKLNQTNNNVDEGDDPKNPEIVGTGMAADPIDQGVAQPEESPSSLLHQLLSSSGVRWTQVTEATEDDIKILKEGKATLVRKAREAATEEDKQKMNPECVPLPMNKEDDSKSEILLKPGVIETLEAKADQQ